MNIKHIYVFVLLCVVFALPVIAQQIPAYPKDQWGKLSKDKQSYVTADGKLMLKVGDTIVLGQATTMNATYSAIHYAGKKNHNILNVILNQNQEPLTGDYVGQRYKIEKLVESSNGTKFGGPKIAYLYITVGKSMIGDLPAEIIIEQALAANEFHLVH